MRKAILFVCMMLAFTPPFYAGAMTTMNGKTMKNPPH